MVFRESGAPRRGWIRADRSRQPEWALTAEAIIAVLPTLMLANLFLSGTIGLTAAGYAVFAVVVAVLLATPVAAIGRQRWPGLALMLVPAAAGWLLPAELGYAAGAYIGVPWAIIAVVNLAMLRR
ncbi:hypothetical protein [uncultured Corynebacterium sp.]|uniref:hypothetical protein n=1 Tax=uncultured Corynebacterium sp. TaxID=159447 RepID=UPI0025D90DE1|nr:hypothetical protein [uncultured Corynebacterium sp.]